MVRKTPGCSGRRDGSAPDSPPTLTPAHLRASIQGPNNRDDHPGNPRAVRTNSLQVLAVSRRGAVSIPIPVPVRPRALSPALLLLEHPERTKSKAIFEPKLHQRSILFFGTLHLGEQERVIDV